MKKRPLISAAIVILPILLVVVALTPHWRDDDAPAVIQQLAEALGIELDYSELVFLDEPCQPDDWQHLVKFELRDGDEVVATQDITTTCKIDCTQTPGATCDDVAAPGPWLGVKDGIFRLCWQGGWLNLKDGRFVVTHTAELLLLEDSRRFIYLQDVEVKAEAEVDLYLVFVPIVGRGALSQRQMLAQFYSYPPGVSLLEDRIGTLLSEGGM